MWHLGNLPGRSLPLYKYALSWQTRDISYIILAYKAGGRGLNIHIGDVANVDMRRHIKGRDIEILEDEFNLAISLSLYSVLFYLWVSIS